MNRSALAVRAASAGADVAAELFRSTLAIETKESPVDYVTAADRRTQRTIIDVISGERPGDAIVGEEEDERKEVPCDGDAWVIDPIDGTTNFINGIQFWTTSVAAVIDGSPVTAANLMPALGDRYVADADGTRVNGDPATVSSESDLDRSNVAPILRYGHDYRDEYEDLLVALSPEVADLRRFGSAQAALSLVASGAIEATVGIVPPYPWDTVAGAYLVEQAGGRVTDVHGNAWSPRRRGIVASNGAVHDALLSVVADTLDHGG